MENDAKSFHERSSDVLGSKRLERFVNETQSLRRWIMEERLRHNLSVLLIALCVNPRIATWCDCHGLWNVLLSFSLETLKGILQKNGALWRRFLLCLFKLVTKLDGFYLHKEMEMVKGKGNETLFSSVLEMTHSQGTFQDPLYD